ncbi:hypothetical protein G3I67_09575 [Orrella sp. NBD-18]|uniref:Glycosyltransferase RgtA/B/C/D-like domain-containing protein n=1 Tax=Sheuella amnicola TaxID=2707330 RepID=A0A6B2QYD9_9BURK|nr:hypothetical protein [Sheuella amnicola]NDY83480.1 hypothetical protein [Sheuella amnicola]
MAALPSNTGGVMDEWLYRFRTPLLLTGVFLGYLLHASNGVWVDDFWDHSAAVSELIRRPWHPHHPQLGIDLPHVFLTPYSLLVAMVAKLCHLNSVESLSLFGIINLSLLLYGVKVFISTNYQEHKRATYFYSLLLILYFWGKNPWNYSGFFHSNIINFSLPYPSSFATGLALIGIALNNKLNTTRESKYLIGVLLITICVLLTHAVAFIFLCTGVVAGTVVHNQNKTQKTVILISLLLCAVCGALLWPYYPLIDLLKGEANVYHLSNKGVYDNVILTLWPVFITIPIFIKKIFKVESRKILVLIMLLMGIYILAWITNKYSYGRVISYIVMLIQIIFALRIAELESYIYQKNRYIVKYIHILIITILFMAFYATIKSSITRLLTITNSIVHGRQILNQQTFGYLNILINKINPDDLILANARTSWILPTFGAKIITLTLPHAFVKDHDQRFSDVEEFFNPKTEEKDRLLVIEKYRPKYILIDKCNDVEWINIANILNKSGNFDSVFEDEKIKLYVVRE